MSAFAVLGAALCYRGVYHCFAGAGLPSTPPFLSRYTSCVNAVVLVVLGLMWGSPGWVTPEAWVFAARCAPLGYLAHDTHLLLTEASLRDWAAVAHHSAFAALVHLAAEAFPRQTAQAFLAEASVPFLHLGWVMARTGADRAYPRLFKGNGAALVATFLALRVCAFPALVVEAYWRGQWVIFGFLAGLTALNWYWFACLLLKVRRAIRAG